MIKHPLDFQVIERTKPVKREGKGRPQKDYIPQTKTVYQIKCTLGELDNDARQKALEQASCFVLITNRLDKSPYDSLSKKLIPLKSSDTIHPGQVQNSGRLQFPYTGIKKYKSRKVTGKTKRLVKPFKLCYNLL